MMHMRLSLALLLFIFLLSCGRPECNNTNAVFEEFAIDSKEYRDELAKQLAGFDKNDLTYWFDRYEERGDREYITVHVQGNGLCAKGFVRVDQWEGLEGIRQSNGMGYRGAQLKDFEMEINQDSSGAAFVFKDIAYIVD